MKFMTFARVSIGWLLAVLLFSVVALGPSTVLAAAESTDTGCPFMVGETSFCSMSLFEHIEHWQSTFTFTLVKFLSFFTVVVPFILVLLVVSRPKLYEWFSEYVRFPTLLQQLFSQGLLNSKAY